MVDIRDLTIEEFVKILPDVALGPSEDEYARQRISSQKRVLSQLLMTHRGKFEEAGLATLGDFLANPQLAIETLQQHAPSADASPRYLRKSLEFFLKQKWSTEEARLRFTHIPLENFFRTFGELNPSLERDAVTTFREGLRDAGCHTVSDLMDVPFSVLVDVPPEVLLMFQATLKALKQRPEKGPPSAGIQR